MVTYLEPRILECEVKWEEASLCTKLGEMIEFQLSCKSAALNMSANLENSAVATGLEKSVFILIPKKGNAKECSNYHEIVVILHTSKVLLKILQANLQ